MNTKLKLIGLEIKLSENYIDNGDLPHILKLDLTKPSINIRNDIALRIQSLGGRTEWNFNHTLYNLSFTYNVTFEWFYYFKDMYISTPLFNISNITFISESITTSEITRTTLEDIFNLSKMNGIFKTDITLSKNTRAIYEIDLFNNYPELSITEYKDDNLELYF